MTHRILIVEDDPFVAIMLEGFLDALDMESVGPAEDIASALALLAKGRFDAAIIDVHLENGETSASVAQALTAAKLPFLITTGSGAIDDPAYSDAPLLTKPFALASLEAALSRLLR
jgi:DNA-binding response OmpR family regulator